MLAGTHVFLRAPKADAIYDAFADHGVTHLCGAPIIMSMISGASEKRNFPQKVKMMTAAAPPPTSVIKGIVTLVLFNHMSALFSLWGLGLNLFPIAMLLLSLLLQSCLLWSLHRLGIEPPPLAATLSLFKTSSVNCLSVHLF